MSAYEEAGKSDDWYTPAYIFDALGETFDLDVAAPPDGPRYVPANEWYYERSLELPWRGFIWMNPPFGHQSTKIKWLQKFFDHGNGIALMPDRTSAPWWQEFAPQASAVLFVAPKVKFERPDGSIGEQPGSGTTLMSAGARGAEALANAKSLGVVFQSVTGGATSPEAV
ncbi:MAG: DNA N-6-adenine-methyltransferase [Pseudomonadota bacterium]